MANGQCYYGFIRRINYMFKRNVNDISDQTTESKSAIKHQ